jgi:FdhE protein
LAAEHPAAAELLTFYAELADEQSSLVEALESAAAAPPTAALLAFRDALDIRPALCAIPDFLRWLTHHGPPALAVAARDLATSDEAAWERGVRKYVTETTSAGVDEAPARAFVIAAVLQPFAEVLADGRRTESAGAQIAGSAHTSSSSATCPLCGGQPVVGALREAGHGAQRSLVCSFCLHERPYLRVLCPSCGEERFDALPVFTTDAFARIRIEACDTCQTYLKTIDLTKDGHAVPLVDDLASVALDLWARERGYRRLCPHLLDV